MATSGTRTNILNDEEIVMWRLEGYVVKRGFVSTAELQHAVMSSYEKVCDSGLVADFGNDPHLSFPSSTHDALNKMTVNQALLDAACSLLDTNHVRLIQSVAWHKEGHLHSNSTSNRDQRLHMDYGNNGFLHPPAWDKPDVVAAIVYLSDTSDTGGSTRLVPRYREGFDELYEAPYVHMPGIANIPFCNDRIGAEEVMRKYDERGAQLRAAGYTRERQHEFRPGDVLFYRHDLWHRGTPVYHNKVRHVLSLAWSKLNAPGISTWNKGFCQPMYNGWFRSFVCGLRGRQLISLGFPPPDHPYWTEQNRALTSARYGIQDIYLHLLARDGT